MILFHGTNVDNDVIDLSKCRPYKDFGKGFYLTPIHEQAARMALRVSRIYGDKPRVFIFEFDETKVNELNVRRFETPTEEWATFVIHNRDKFWNCTNGGDSNHDNRYDIVIGPVANDDLALLFRQFASGYLTREMLAREMTYKKLTIQYSFHTTQAVRFLTKLGVDHV